MQLDLNLLTALDALLEEGSVGGAADRLHLSQPAMSRALGRIRLATGDPILVRAGRTMVPTPRAMALRAEVHALTERAHAVLSPDREVDLSTLTRVFTVQCHDAVASAIGARLIAAIYAQAPGAALRLLSEASVDTSDLRQGRVDLEIGTIDEVASEVRVEELGQDRMVGVVRPGHLLGGVGAGAKAGLVDQVTAERFAEALHIGISRRGRLHGPIDDALAEKHLSRRVVAAAPTTAAALWMVRESDLVATVAERLCRASADALGLQMFELPFELPALRVSQAWHHRYDADPAHAWLRGLVSEAVQGVCGG